MQGYETTHTTSYIIFLLMGLYPEYQERVHNEICEVFPKWTGNVTNEDLSRLVYLEQFIKETQRLFPAIPLLTRYNSKEMIVGMFYSGFYVSLLLYCYEFSETLYRWQIDTRWCRIYFGHSKYA